MAEMASKADVRKLLEGLAKLANFLTEDDVTYIGLVLIRVTDRLLEKQGKSKNTEK